MGEDPSLLDWLARTVTTKRTLVLVGLVAITAAFASQIPRITVDPSVENLISSYEGEEIAKSTDERFVGDFGGTDRVMLLVLQADDALAAPALQHLHDLTTHVSELDWVESVFSLTQTPLPRRHREATPEGGTLDDLEAELGGGLDELEGELDDESDAVDSALRAEVVDRLVELVEADPMRFPGGFQELGPKLSSQLVTTPIVEGDTVDPEEIEELKLLLTQNDLIQGRLISENRKVAVTAFTTIDISSDELLRSVMELDEYLDDHPPPSGVRVHLGGLPHLRTSIVQSIRSDNAVMVPLTVIVCMLLLAVALRWLPGVLLPITAVGLTALIVVGGMAMANEPLNVVNNVIPTLLIIIGISDSIHLIGRYREELVRGGKAQTREAAARKTVHGMTVACLLTSLTTAVGLASLVVSKTVMLRHFGVTAAIGVMAAFLVTIGFLPAALTSVKKPSMTAQTAHGWLEAAIMRMTAWVLRRPWQIVALTGVLLAGSMWVSTKLNIDHALLDQFDQEDDVYQVTRLLENELDGVRPLEISLTSQTEGRFYDSEVLSKVDSIARWSDARSEVIATTSQSDILRQMYYILTLDPETRRQPLPNTETVRALSGLLGVETDRPNPLASWVDDDRTHLRLQIKVRDIGAQATVRFIDDLDEQLGQAFDGSDVNYAFTGEAYSGSKGMEAVVGDLLASLLTAVVIIFVLLTLLFRSLRLGLLSIPPNIIPLVLTMAYMVMRSIPLNAATGIIFSISLGLAVDGSIHVLARFREETLDRGMQAHPALIRAARGTGRAIVVSCATLMAGFSVLLLSSFVPVQRFGELIAISVAGCLVATLIVQPALLQVAGLSRRETAELRTRAQRAIEAAR